MKPRRCSHCCEPGHTRRRHYSAVSMKKNQPRHCGRCGMLGHDRRTCSHSRFVPGVRKALGERMVDGEIHQVLDCGHTVLAVLDSDGNWVSEWCECKQCQSGVPGCRPLYEGEPEYDFKRKAWQRLRKVAERPVRGNAFQTRT